MILQLTSRDTDGKGEMLGSLSTHVFETRTATGSELFSLLTCLHTTTFILRSIFSPLEMIRVKMWEEPLSWHEKCFLPVAVRVSNTRVLKLSIQILDAELETEKRMGDLLFVSSNMANIR